MQLWCEVPLLNTFSDDACASNAVSSGFWIAPNLERSWLFSVAALNSAKVSRDHTDVVVVEVRVP